MHGRPTLRQRLWLGGLASAGVVLSHWLSYVLVAPHEGEREALLALTGHGAWKTIVAVALGALVAGLAGFVADAAGSDASGRALIFRSTAPRLIALQGIGFLVLEAAERVASAVPVAAIHREPAVLIGLLVQVVVAVLAALVLAALARLVERLVVGRQRIGTETSPSRVASQIAAPHLAPASGGATLRGPPAPA